MAMVLDASVVAASLLPDESDPIADTAFERLAGDPGIVPAHWWFEVRSILLVAERRSRLTRAETERALLLLGQLPITIRSDPVEAAMLRLARRHHLTVYDAAYLELAMRLAAPIATWMGHHHGCQKRRRSSCWYRRLSTIGSHDDLGIDLTGIGEAKALVVETLSECARERVPAGNSRTVVVTAYDERGVAVYGDEATITGPAVTDETYGVWRAMAAMTRPIDPRMG